jgi:hypothetical protein
MKNRATISMYPTRKMFWMNFTAHVVE